MKLAVSPGFRALLVILALLPSPRALARGAVGEVDGVSAEAAADTIAPFDAQVTDNQRADTTAADSVPADSALLVAQVADSVAADSAVAPVATPPRDYWGELRANFTPENRTYSDIKTVLRFIGPLYGTLAGLLVLFSGLSANLRDVAHGMGRSRWVRVVVYLALFTGVTFVLSFPLTWYDGFAIEHQYGLSGQSLGQWMTEQGKAAALGLFVLGVIPILWLIYTTIARSPRAWWLWLGLGSLPFIVAGTLLGPLVVDPVFNRFAPLENQQLKARILDLAARAHIPGRNVFQVDKSRQTNRYNAYVNGFGVSQRIVLWDTTLKGMSEDEILFVVGHEMGHYKLGHIWTGMLFASAFSLVVFFLAALISGWAMRRFGRWWGFSRLEDVASLPLLYVAVSLVLFVTQPAVHAFSRRQETEADLYGLELTHDNDAAARAFVKLAAQNKTNPEPSPFVKWALFSHPPDGERLRLALTYRPWEEGGPNRYLK